MSALKGLKSGKDARVAKYSFSPNIRDMSSLELNFNVINLVQECQTFKCDILIFLIPFSLLLAETLVFFEKSSVRNTLIFQLYLSVIQKINRIKNSNNSQLPEAEIDTEIVFLLKYYSFSRLQISRKLGDFILRH